MFVVFEGDLEEQISFPLARLGIKIKQQQLKIPGCLRKEEGVKLWVLIECVPDSSEGAEEQSGESLRKSVPLQYCSVIRAVWPPLSCLH